MTPNTPLEELIEKLEAMIENGGDADLIAAVVHANGLLQKESELINPLDASRFKSGDRINHFYVNALRQLTEEECNILANSLRPDRTEEIAIGFSKWKWENGWRITYLEKEKGLCYENLSDWPVFKTDRELFKDYIESLKP